jgi:MtrB/PioB family decaheme-associated outer membrane protein
MNKRLISILIANLFVAAPAFAQSDDFKVEGSVSLGAMNTDVSVPRDRAKLFEYRDLSNGLIGNIELRGRSSQYWIDAFGENFGRDDQYITLRGGMYDQFKYRLYTDALKHNFLFNGITPYGPNNTATFPALDLGKWNPVDIGYKRRDEGGYFEYQGASPWYVRVDGNQVTWNGSKPGASSLGTSPGNGYVDLSFPVDYKTKNASVEGGYTAKTMAFSLSWMTSKFEDANKSFDWTNGYFGNGRDTTYLAPDNKYWRIAANATFRQLPANSTLALRYTTDELKSDAVPGTSVLNTTTGGFAPTGPDESSFNGKVENRTFTAALASAPMKGLDTRLYYNYYKRDDKSTVVEFNDTSATGAGGPFAFDRLSYKKNNFGLDAYYRLNRENRLGAGYDHLKTERTRFDFDETRDNRYFVEWKNSSIENLSARVKYMNLSRKSNFLLGNEGVNSGDVNYLNRFVTAFDLSNLDQDQWKLTLDFSPVQFLDLSFEGIVKNNKYKDNVLGRKKDDRREYYASASYGDPSSLRFTVFADAEDITYDSQHRILSFGTTAIGAYDPSTPPTTTNYNWTGRIKDKNWATGITLDWPAMDKLLLKATAIYYKTDGSVDLALQDGVPASVVRPVPIDTWDDSKRTSFGLKAIYTLNKTVTLTGGYAYEKYEYADSQYDNYRYTVPATARQDSYLNGIYAFPQYKANIFYFLVGYRF